MRVGPQIDDGSKGAYTAVAVLVPTLGTLLIVVLTLVCWQPVEPKQVVVEDEAERVVIATVCFNICYCLGYG